MQPMSQIIVKLNEYEAERDNVLEQLQTEIEALKSALTNVQANNRQLNSIIVAKDERIDQLMAHNNNLVMQITALESRQGRSL